MGNENRNTGTREFQNRQYLRDFITGYEQLSKLWNVRSKEYSKRDEIKFCL